MLIQNVLFGIHFELFWLMQLINIDTKSHIKLCKKFLGSFSES